MAEGQHETIVACRKTAKQLRSTIQQQTEEKSGLLQVIRDNEETIEDLREQLSQAQAELDGAKQRIRTLEGEADIHEIQLRMLLAGEETHLSWLRTQKSLFEAEAARAVASRGFNDEITG